MPRAWAGSSGYRARRGCSSRSSIQRSRSTCSWAPPGATPTSTSTSAAPRSVPVPPALHSLATVAVATVLRDRAFLGLAATPCGCGRVGSSTRQGPSRARRQVWYHIVEGEKWFYCLPPTPPNLRAFESWSTRCHPNDGPMAPRRCPAHHGRALHVVAGGGAGRSSDPAPPRSPTQSAVFFPDVAATECIR